MNKPRQSRAQSAIAPEDSSPQQRVVKGSVLLALAVAALWLYPVHYDPTVNWLSRSGYETLALASSIAHGRGFTDPFGVLATGPSAHLAPAYPAFLALILKIVPRESAALFAME